MSPLFELMSQTWYFQVILVLQAICVFHVLRHSREYFWIWIILFVPLIGCGIYLYLHGRSAFSAVNPGNYLKIPMLYVFNARAVERDYRINGSLDNKIRYADVLMAQDELDSALALFADEIDGPLRNNVHLLFTYAKILFATERFTEVIAMLERAEKVQNNDRIKQRHLLHALALEKLEQLEAADARFQLAQGGFVGEEAKVRYGLFLLARNRSAEAERLFRKVVESCAISSWSYRREQRIWNRLAQEQLKALTAKPE